MIFDNRIQQQNRYISRTGANEKRRQDTNSQEVKTVVGGAPNAFFKRSCGTLRAMIVRVDNDTSSRLPKDLGRALRRTLRATVRSHDSLANIAACSVPNAWDARQIRRFYNILTV